MTLELAIQLATLASLLVAIGGLYLTYRNFTSQMNSQAFMTYNDRVEKVMSSLPPDAIAYRLDSRNHLPELSSELTHCILKYLNLCSEEFYLYRHGYLDGRVWLIWEAEIKRMLCTPLLRREWLHLQHEFSSYVEFKDWVEHLYAAEDAKNRTTDGSPLTAIEIDEGDNVQRGWYYSDDGLVRHGPYTPKQLHDLAREGVLKPSAMLWKPGAPRWKEARKAKGLFPS